MNKDKLWILILVIIVLAAGIAVYAVYTKNKMRKDYSGDILAAINTPHEYGTTIYDVMLYGQRNN